VSDKRSVATDALETLGTIIDETQKRDAIHLAVEPIVAPEWLDPGEHVTASGHGCGVGEGVGIVDPFLTYRVKPGERFWLVIYPRQIKSLRHVWGHPAFADEPEVMAAKTSPTSKAESEMWLRDFIAHADCPDFETVIAAATGAPVEPDSYYGGPAYEIDGDYLFFRGRDAHSEIPPEFWVHLEIYTGHKAEFRPAHFSCSC
jgi:hypothetical protein